MPRPLQRCLNSVARSPARTVHKYPERFAQMALGHNSKAVHRAYAKKAQVTIPPLEEFERKPVGEILQVSFAERATATSTTTPAMVDVSTVPAAANGRRIIQFAVFGPPDRVASAMMPVSDNTTESIPMVSGGRGDAERRLKDRDIQ